MAGTQGSMAPQPPMPSEPVGPPPSTQMGPPRFKPSNGTIMMFIAVAGTLLLVGAILLQIRTVLEQPTYRTPEYLSWLQLMRFLTFIGVMMIDIGVFIFVAGSIYAGVARVDLIDGVRRSLVIMSFVLISVWLFVFFLGTWTFP